MTVTVEPTFLSPLTFVLAVRLMSHTSFPFCTVILSLVTAMTFPVIWAVCANAVLLSVRLAAAIAISPNASFYARCSLDLFRSSLRNPP